MRFSDPLSKKISLCRLVICDSIVIVLAFSFVCQASIALAQNDSAIRRESADPYFTRTRINPRSVATRRLREISFAQKTATQPFRRQMLRLDNKNRTRSQPSRNLQTAWRLRKK